MMIIRGRDPFIVSYGMLGYNSKIPIGIGVRSYRFVSYLIQFSISLQSPLYVHLNWHVQNFREPVQACSKFRSDFWKKRWVPDGQDKDEALSPNPRTQSLLRL